MKSTVDVLDQFCPEMTGFRQIKSLSSLSASSNVLTRAGSIAQWQNALLACELQEMSEQAFPHGPQTQCLGAPTLIQS